MFIFGDKNQSVYEIELVTKNLANNKYEHVVDYVHAIDEKHAMDLITYIYGDCIEIVKVSIDD